MQSSEFITRLTDIAGACWTLAGDCVRNHADKSREAYQRRTAQWRAIATAVVELDRDLTRDDKWHAQFGDAQDRN